MEVYILDNLNRRIEVIDWFESLIWTERYSAMGDFEIVIESNSQTRKLLAVGTYLVHNESLRVMKVEVVENKTDSEGRFMLTAKGRSLESILLDRVAKASMSSLTTNSKWALTGTPGNIARTVFDQICRTGVLDVNDKIPFITAGNIFPADTIAEPSSSISLEIEIATVYDAIKEICDNYRLGFRLVRHPETGLLYFNVHTGRDRTTLQSVDSPIIFAPDLDNLQNVTELTSVAGIKNVAYVYHKNGFRKVYAEGTTSEVTGFVRAVLPVKLDGDEAAGAALDTLMELKGKEALAKYRSLSGFDGEVPQFGTYKYGIDYHLGDLIEMRNEDGLTNQMRVTEQIFVSDREGERSYPTLTIDRFIMPGTWLAWDYNQEWADGGATEYWANA